MKLFMLSNVLHQTSDFSQKVMLFIDNIALYKIKAVKNTQKGFDGKDLEKPNARNKLFQRPKLHIDKALLKKGNVTY